MTVNYFCVRNKNSQKHDQHFKLLLFKMNVHFGTSDLNIYVWKTKFTSYKHSHMACNIAVTSHFHLI